jgi:hypothetical protein
MNDAVSILASAAVLFLRALQYMVFAHVIISWVSLLGAYLYVRPLEVSVRVLYGWVRKVVPTAFGPVDFAPAIVIVGTQIAISFLLPFSA